MAETKKKATKKAAKKTEPKEEKPKGVSLTLSDKDQAKLEALASRKGKSAEDIANLVMSRALNSQPPLYR